MRRLRLLFERLDFPWILAGGLALCSLWPLYRGITLFSNPSRPAQYDEYGNLIQTDKVGGDIVISAFKHTGLGLLILAAAFGVWWFFIRDRDEY